MARSRFSRLPRSRQDEILRLAAVEFAKHGFEGTSYNALLERLKLGKSSAYYYFEDKRDLFLTTVARSYERFFERLAELPEPRDKKAFWAYCEQSARLGFEFMLEDQTAADLMQCFQRERALSSELLSYEVLHGMSEFYGRLARLGRRLGALSKDMPETLQFRLLENVVVTFDQWFVEVSRSADFPGTDACAELLVDTLRRLAGTGPSARESTRRFARPVRKRARARAAR